MQGVTTSIRVLHVDDDAEFSALTSTFLERGNDAFSLVTETDATVSLDRLADGDFDAVVSDYEMPGMDGIEFLRAVRANYPTLPFILFTGKGSEEVASEAITHGVTDYLQKSSGRECYSLLANRLLNAVEKSRMTRQFEESQQRYERIAQLSSEAFWTWDVEDDEFILSDGFERVFEHPAGTVENGYAWAVEQVHPADRKKVTADVQSIVDAGTRGFESEYRFRRGDGTYVKVQSRRSAITNENGDVETLVGVLIDCSAQHRNEQAIEQYETLFEALPDAAWMVDSRGILRFVNDTLRERIGDAIPQDSILGQSYRDLLVTLGVDSETIDEVTHEVTAVLQEDTTLGQVEVILDLEGSPVARELLMVPVKMNNETWVVGLSRDVTERKRAEDRAKSLFEKIADPIVMFGYNDSSDPTIYSVNEEFERVFGYTAEAAAGQSLRELIVPEEYAGESLDISWQIRSGMSVDREVVRQTHDGMRRNFRFQVVYTEDSGDHRVYYGVYQDITEEKQYAERLEVQNDRLDEFAGRVTHDIRNPLHAAQEWLKVARKEDDASKALTHVESALSRLDVIVTDMLALARHGGEILDTESVALESVVEQAWRMAGRETATLDIEAPLGAIDADESRAVALFENLFRNAIEHGGSDITVRIGRLSDASGFYIEDDGPGIPENDYQQVFESGYTTTTTGAGFGLAIVKEIVDAHGWTISVETGLEGGTRFEVTGMDT